MSLFKARDWWSTHISQSDEEFDKGCLATGVLDPTNPQNHQIVVGSHSGLIRVFSPTAPATYDEENGEENTSKADSLLLEDDLRQPIIQVAIGRFVSAVDRNHIAVLQPRRIVVFGLNSTPGSTAHGTQWQIRPIYEHSLKRTAFNFTWGPFGRVSDKDFLCVQSMDGTLSVFEQESFAFSRFLPDALLPGPISYMPSTDSFVTVSSMRQVESYKYQTLAVATDAKTKEEAQSLKSGKRVKADWVFNIGETAVDMQVYHDQFLVVLGRRNLYCLADNGKLRFMMRLEFAADCVCLYGIRGADTLLILLASSGGELLVYQNTLLRWAARMNSPPIDIRVADFQNLRGSIVALSQRGLLETIYLGTDPANNAVTAPAQSEIREIDYARSDTELHELQRRIKVASGKAPALMPTMAATKAAENELRITIELPRGLDDQSQAGDTQLPANTQNEEEDDVLATPPSITAQIYLRPKAHMNNVQLSVNVKAPIGVNQLNYFFSYVDSNNPGECVVSFFMKAPFVPSDLVVRLIANYNNISGAPRVAQATFSLPLKLVVSPALPVKQAQYKLTIDTNKPPANLETLFSELRIPDVDSQGSAVAFQYIGRGPVVTVLASKSSQRYRVQSDSFEALWLLTRELVNRLEASTGSGFVASYTSALPLGEYFEVLDNHYETRANLIELQSLVGQRAEQFRAIQRRLLTRFKDKTPAPLQNLDSLLEGSMRQLIQMADMVEDGKRHLQRASCALASATNLLGLLMRFSNSLTEENYNVLQNVLSGSISDHDSCGMEEIYDVALTHMLRAVLSKASKDVQLSTAPLEMPKDTQRLKKHINMLCDRLGKGVQLATEVSGAGGSEFPDKNARPSMSNINLAPIAIVKDVDENPGGLLSMENKFNNFRSPRGNGGEKEIKKKKKKKKKKTVVNEEDLPGTEDDLAFRQFKPTMNEEQLSKLSALGDLDDLISPFGDGQNNVDENEDVVETRQNNRKRYMDPEDSAEADFYG